MEVNSTVLKHPQYKYEIEMKRLDHSSMQLRLSDSHYLRRTAAWNLINHRVFELFEIRLPEQLDFSYHYINAVDDSMIINFFNLDQGLDTFRVYQDLLIEEGFIAEAENHDFEGSFLLNEINVKLNYTYDEYHQMLIFELASAISLEEKIWKDINTEIYEMFGFELPIFIDFQTADYAFISEFNRATIIIGGINNRQASLFAYMLLLEENDWLADAYNNDHMGSFEKSDLNVILGYHESHGFEDTLELHITPYINQY